MSIGKTTKLAPDLEISTILTGLWQIADMEKDGKKLDPKSTAKSMQLYVDAGFTTFDMADHYGSAEIIAGKFREIGNHEGNIQLLTKWVPPPGKVSKADVRKAIETALNRLKIDKIDLLQYHAWHYPDPAWLDTLFELQNLKNEGLIKHLGVTNFDSAHLRIAASSGIKLVSNQVSFSLLDRRANNQMKQVCNDYNVKLLAFGTIAGGFLSKSWLNQEEPNLSKLKTWSQMKYKRYIDEVATWSQFQSLLQSLDGISNKHGVTITNIASKYVLSQEHVAGVILGARLGQSEHIQENLALYSFELDSDDVSEIDSIVEVFGPIPGDCGDEYRKPPFLTASGDLSDHLESIPNPFEEIDTRNGKQKVLSGTIWEDMAGFSRAVRSGNRIIVSGTTATHRDQMIGGSDAAAQTHFIIDKIQGAIESLGGKLEDIDRTRIFVNNESDWEPVARAHGERFKDIQPANTLVEARIIGDGYLVEMEAEASIR